MSRNPFERRRDVNPFNMESIPDLMGNMRQRTTGNGSPFNFPNSPLSATSSTGFSNDLLNPGGHTPIGFREDDGIFDYSDKNMNDEDGNDNLSNYGDYDYDEVQQQYVKKEPSNSEYGLQDEDDDVVEDEEESKNEDGYESPDELEEIPSPNEYNQVRPVSPPTQQGIVYVHNPMRPEELLLCEENIIFEDDRSFHHPNKRRRVLDEDDDEAEDEEEVEVQGEEGEEVVNYAMLTEEEVQRVIDKHIPWVDLNCFLGSNILGLRSLREMIITSGGQFNPYTKELIEEMKSILEQISNALVQKESGKFFEFDLRHLKKKKRVRHSSVYFDSDAKEYYVTYGKKVRFVAYINNLIRFQVKSYDNIQNHIRWTILWLNGEQEELNYTLKYNNERDLLTKNKKKKKKKRGQKTGHKRGRNSSEPIDLLIDNEGKMYLEAEYIFRKPARLSLRIELRQSNKKTLSEKIGAQLGHTSSDKNVFMEISKPPSLPISSSSNDMIICLSENFDIFGFCDAQYRKKVLEFNKWGYRPKCSEEDIIRDKKKRKL